MRLPYVPDPPITRNSEEAKILERVQPDVADGWNSFLGAIRTRTSLPAAIQELIICRVAVLNGALFEWDHHAPLLIDPGTSHEALNAVQDENVDIIQKVNEGVLSPAARTVIRYTDAMTRNVSFHEGIFTAVQEFYNSQEIVGITATVAAYNCVSRFLVALDVGEKQKESKIST
ncbi:hypothetical protein BDV12DRAFT_208051 [Aspergillus spectabilis]